MQKFGLPVDQLANQDYFSEQEPGLNHPTQPSHVRLHNNGDVELTAGEAVSLILHAAGRSITFVADEVKFLTKDTGFRWNNLSLNKDAYQFNQPTFFQSVSSDAKSLYRGASVFLSTSDEKAQVAANQTPEPTVLTGDQGTQA